MSINLSDGSTVTFEGADYYEVWAAFIGNPTAALSPVEALAARLKGRKGIATVMVVTERGKESYKGQLDLDQITEYLANGILNNREGVLNQQIFGMALETAGWRRTLTFPSRNERGIKEIHVYVKD